MSSEIRNVVKKKTANFGKEALPKKTTLLLAQFATSKIITESMLKGGLIQFTLTALVL